MELKMLLIKKGKNYLMIDYLEQEVYAMDADRVKYLHLAGVDQDIEHLTYKRTQRPMFPFDKDMKEPDLSVRFIPVSEFND